MADLYLPMPDGKTVIWYGIRSVVIVGANGSGKSQLGFWIESGSRPDVRRITAQRALSIPLVIPPVPLDQAEANLHYGYYDLKETKQQLANRKWAQRWGDDPVNRLLNDFDNLLGVLFGDEWKVDREYCQHATAIAPIKVRPKSRLDRLQEVWSSVLPQRMLVLSTDRIEARSANGQPYAGRGMSDGERVVFYLIGEALCAPSNSIIVIDEPEIHLHRAIQAPLWDAIEKLRPDCAFVYITHDLEFAATRTTARKIWVKSYEDKHKWEWEEVSPNDALPDALLFSVYGSRRPVLFVEGGDSSYDTSVYSALFPDNLVIPRQNASKVIEATKAMGNLPSLHHLQIGGLVDRDRRSDDEIAALRKQGVQVADVAEVENLLCLPEAIAYVAAQLHKADVAAEIKKAEKKVLAELSGQIEEQSLQRALATIQFQLNGFGPKAGKLNVATLSAEFGKHVSSIDIQRATDENTRLFSDIVVKADYRAALRYFNCKGIPSFVAGELGIGKDAYIHAVIGALKDNPIGPVATAMKGSIS